MRVQPRKWVSILDHHCCTLQRCAAKRRPHDAVHIRTVAIRRGVGDAVQVCTVAAARRKPPSSRSMTSSYEHIRVCICLPANCLCTIIVRSIVVNIERCERHAVLSTIAIHVECVPGGAGQNTANAQDVISR
jgi:hypothetical protein